MEEAVSQLNNHSFNYQDIFAYLCNGKRQGVFVDIGCSYSHNISNVKFLLERGWCGVGFDMNSDIIDSWNNFHGMEINICDVMDSHELINNRIKNIGSVIDYLSIDVDGFPCEYIVEHLDFENVKYRCATIEHDAYQYGDDYKNAQRKVLLGAGYEVVMKNLAEDWYVYPSLISDDFLKLLRVIPEDYIQGGDRFDDICEYLKFNLLFEQ